MGESKPFDATPSRLERARREGDVLRSSELVAVAALAAGFVDLLAVVGPLAEAARAALTQAARGGGTLLPAYGAMVALACSVPAAASGGALLANVLPGGGLSLKFPAPEFERLDPRAGLRRMFSRDSLAAIAKACVAGSALALALLPVARDALAESDAVSPERIASRTLGALERSVAVAIGSGAAFAWLDLLIERAKRRRRLRMSFDELKRDQKQTEGDPALRGRRRQAHRALAHGALQRLGEAALIVANPTHVAVALAYRPPEIPVPQVLVRASDETAKLVKTRGLQLGIPIIEDVALARKLFAQTNPGDFIPRDAYVAVAAIVAGLIRCGKLRA
jgi:flagellar biosynthetic protein FlhB